MAAAPALAQTGGCPTEGTRRRDSRPQHQRDAGDARRHHRGGFAVQGPIEFTRKDVALKARPFAQTQVRLLPGTFHDAQDWNQGYMSRDADRLLYNFRVNAGYPRPVTGLRGRRQRQLGAASDGHGHRTARAFHGTLLSASAQLWLPPATKTRKLKAI